MHTLAVKGLRLHEEAFDAAMVEESEVEAMMKCARDTCSVWA